MLPNQLTPPVFASREPFKDRDKIDLVRWGDTGELELVPTKTANKLEKDAAKPVAVSQPSTPALESGGGRYDPILKALAAKRSAQMLASNDLNYSPPEQNFTPATPTPAASPAGPQLTPEQIRQLHAEELNKPTALGIPKGELLDAMSQKVLVPGSPGRAARNAQTEANRYQQREAEGTKVEGPNLTPEQQAELVANAERNQRLKEESTRLQGQLDIQKAEQDVALNKGKLEGLERIKARDAEIQKQAENEYNQLRLTTEREVEESGKAEPDQSRFFNSKSGWRQALMAVSVALSGYARDGGDGGIVMRFIERDIQSQAEAIRARRGRADNALTKLSARFGSLEAGKAALRATENTIMGQQLQKQAAEFGTKNAQLAAQKAQVDALARSEEYMQALKLSFVGNRQQELRTSFQDPVTAIAPTAAHYRDPTPVEVDANIARKQGLYKTAAGIRGDDAEYQKKLAETNKLLSEASGSAGLSDADNRMIVSLAPDLTKLTMLEAAFKQAADVHGFKLGEDGQLASEDIPGALPGIAGIMAAGTQTILPKSREAERMREIVAQNLITALTGAVSQPVQDELMRSWLSNDKTEEGITRGFNRINQFIQDRRAQLTGSLDPKVQDELRKRNEYAKSFGYSGGIGKPASNPFDDGEDK
jgi:hypothetical protein